MGQVLKLNLYLIFIIIISLIGIEFCFKKGNKEYLSKTNTSCIKGIFILIVFYSHFTQYTAVNMSKDFLMYDFKVFLGQLMVTLFLFYSGYGIFESIKNKKNYIKQLPKKRIFKVWFQFAIAVSLFLILQLILKNPDLNIKRILLSYVGWSGLGNSNWYIFGILLLYISSFLSFSIFNKEKDYRKAIILNYILTIILILFLSVYKEIWWYNTLLCYNLGLSFSYHKKAIEEKLFNWKSYIIILFTTTFSFLVLYHLGKENFWYYELCAMSFCLLVVELTVIINLRSKVLKWFGDKLFWVYILQRLPMIILVELGYTSHPYRFALISFIVTIVLVLIVDFISKNLDKLIVKQKDKKIIKASS